MFKQLKSLATAYENYMTHRGRVEAHRILMTQDEKALSDIGIDRYELKGGVKYWPWDGSRAVPQTAKTVQTPIAKAIRELSSYSDRELRDLGISRGMIADAVENGRPGIDDVTHTSAAPVRRARAA